MLGIIYFYDGHTEEIIDSIEHCTGELVLESESGLYSFWDCVAMYEDPYWNHQVRKFYKWYSDIDEWIEITDINHIEIYNEE